MVTGPSPPIILRQIRKLEKYLDELNIVPAAAVYRSRIILALLSKALTVARAICVLVDAGFPAEAFGMSRTLIEIYFCVRYISNKNTEMRSATYAEYGARVQQEWRTIILKHFPDTKITFPPLDIDVAAMAKEFPSKHQWTGRGGQAKFMALEEDGFELDESGKGIKSEFDYDAIYFWTSHFVHATVIALDGHVPDAGAVFRVRAKKKAEQRYGRRALFNAVVFLSKTFICACRAMREEQPESLQTLFNLSTKFAIDIEGRGVDRKS
jgi:Family of unknown function (DUF5677)